MAATTASERAVLNEVRATMARLKSSQAAVVHTRAERIQFMRRRIEGIELDLRHGSEPTHVHLISIAAHAVILASEMPKDRNG